MGGRELGGKDGRREEGQGGALCWVIMYVLCSVTLVFPFFEGVARAFSVIVACGRCVCVCVCVWCVCASLTAKIAVHL